MTSLNSLNLHLLGSQIFSRALWHDIKMFEALGFISGCVSCHEEDTDGPPPVYIVPGDWGEGRGRGSGSGREWRGGRGAGGEGQPVVQEQGSQGVKGDILLL